MYWTIRRRVKVYGRGKGMLRICLTGGPGAGKTEICSHLAEELENRGYFVFFVPETATELMLNGIRPNNYITGTAFQSFVIDKQLSKETLYNDLANYYPEDKIVIFYDRGLLDGGSYIPHDEFITLLQEKGLTVADVYSHYDAVLHLVTAADGAERYYQWNNPESDSVGNNASRLETPEQARVQDKKTLNAWVGHPHLRVFDNSTDFEGKVKRVVKEVFALLGEPEPKEIERKFLIKKPTAAEIAKLGCVAQTDIIQTYLKSTNSIVERRVRQRGTPQDGYIFYYTEKRDVGLGERIEREERISQAEYIRYLTEADTSLHMVSKRRFCFMFSNHYFEMDVYAFDSDYAIVEVELNDLNEPIDMPDLTVIKEVTGDSWYKNKYIAQTLKLDV